MAINLNLKGACNDGPFVECSHDFSTSTPRYKYVIRRATSASYVVGSGQKIPIALTDNGAVGYLAWNTSVATTIAANGCGCGEATCVIQPSCVCARRRNLVAVRLLHTPGSISTSNNSGTYFASVGGENCLWQITVTNEDSQWRLERRVLNFIGVRLVFTALIGGASIQIVRLFNPEYCLTDDPYTFGPFYEGSLFEFTVLG